MAERLSCRARDRQAGAGIHRYALDYADLTFCDELHTLSRQVIAGFLQTRTHATMRTHTQNGYERTRSPPLAAAGHPKRTFKSEYVLLFVQNYTVMTRT